MILNQASSETTPERPDKGISFISWGASSDSTSGLQEQRAGGGCPYLVHYSTSLTLTDRKGVRGSGLLTNVSCPLSFCWCGQGGVCVCVCVLAIIEWLFSKSFFLATLTFLGLWLEKAGFVRVFCSVPIYRFRLPASIIYEAK